ncbi:MAG: TolC family protein [Betaproteobacteria bacterium]|nr:TolC family protein [Betaproteobacteria bacterium]
MPADSLTLHAALGIALTTHPDLRVAGADLAVAHAESAFARVPAFNPQLEFQAARGGQSLGSGSEGTLDLGVSQELELWGKRAARANR